MKNINYLPFTTIDYLFNVFMQKYNSKFYEDDGWRNVEICNVRNNAYTLEKLI